MSFFDHIDEEARHEEAPRPSRYGPPEWFDPQINLIPATVALDLRPARTERVAVWVAEALV